MFRVSLHASLALVVLAATLLCVCGPGCCVELHRSQNGSNPLDGPRCACTATAEPDLESSLTIAGAIPLPEWAFPSNLVGQADGIARDRHGVAPFRSRPKLFIANHQFVI